jgi:hypothetical protein
MPATPHGLPLPVILSGIVVLIFIIFLFHWVMKYDQKNFDRPFREPEQKTQEFEDVLAQRERVSDEVYLGLKDFLAKRDLPALVYRDRGRREDFIFVMDTRFCQPDPIISVRVLLAELKKKGGGEPLLVSFWPSSRMERYSVAEQKLALGHIGDHLDFVLHHPAA